MTTSKPSQATLWPDSDGSTSSPEGSRVNHSRSLAGDAARRMTAISGQRWLPLLRSADRPTCWLRTLIASERWHSMTYSMTWKQRTTPSGRLTFRLALSPLPIDDIACGPLPTVTVNGNYNRKGVSSQSGDGIRTALVRALPTLLAADAEGGRTVPEGTVGGKRPDGSKVSVGIRTALLREPPTHVADDTGHRRGRYAQGGTPLSHALDGPLDPEWLEPYMGYPIGWTELGDSATPSSPRSRTS